FGNLDIAPGEPSAAPPTKEEAPEEEDVFQDFEIVSEETSEDPGFEVVEDEPDEAVAEDFEIVEEAEELEKPAKAAKAEAPKKPARPAPAKKPAPAAKKPALASW